MFADVIRNAIETENHAVTAVLPEHDVHLDADFTRLAQVFANLINNAAKYTQQGGTIRLMAQASETELRVTLRDSGIGIATDKLPYIFGCSIRSTARWNARTAGSASG